VKLFARNGNQLVATNPASDTGARTLLPHDGSTEGCCCEGFLYWILWPCCCPCDLGAGCNCVEYLVVDQRLIEFYQNGQAKPGPYKYAGKCWRIVTRFSSPVYPPLSYAVHSWGEGEGLYELAGCSSTVPDDTGICPPCGPPPDSCCNYVAFPRCTITDTNEPDPCRVLGSTYRFANGFSETIREVGIRPEDVRSRSDGTLAAPEEIELYFYRRVLFWRRTYGSGISGCPLPDNEQDLFTYEIQETRVLYDLEWTTILPDGTVPPGSQLVRVNIRTEGSPDSGQINGPQDAPFEELLRPVYLRPQDPPPQNTFPPNISYSGPGSACAGTYLTDIYTMRGALAFHSEERIEGSMSAGYDPVSNYSSQRYELNSTEYFFPDRYSSQFQRRREYVRSWQSNKNAVNESGCDETFCPGRGLVLLPPRETIALNTSGGCSKCRRERGL
jgi:hypothetical protein